CGQRWGSQFDVVVPDETVELIDVHRAGPGAAQRVAAAADHQPSAVDGDGRAELIALLRHRWAELGEKRPAAQLGTLVHEHAAAGDAVLRVADGTDGGVGTLHSHRYSECVVD